MEVVTDAGDSAVLEFDDAIGHLGNLRVVCDHHHCGALGPYDVLDDAQHFNAGLVIKRCGGLVGENDLGVLSQRARNRHALLLAAGHLRRIIVSAVRQSHLRKGLVHILGGRADLSDKLHILPRSKVRHQII